MGKILLDEDNETNRGMLSLRMRWRGMSRKHLGPGATTMIPGWSSSIAYWRRSKSTWVSLVVGLFAL